MQSFNCDFCRRLFGNRSLCFEKLQEYEKALADAELSLSMLPGWVKGLFRRGRALAGLKVNGLHYICTTHMCPVYKCHVEVSVDVRACWWKMKKCKCTQHAMLTLLQQHCPISNSISSVILSFGKPALAHSAWAQYHISSHAHIFLIKAG